ncbi:MAG: PAS domain-containing protein [Betaproteobacteria bacterium]|nr:PAS domain-containing protein [Betaproteobacteria bacterium]
MGHLTVVGSVLGAGLASLWARITSPRRAAAAPVAERLRRCEARLSHAQSLAKLGTWELDLAKDELSWSDQTFRIFGLEPWEPGEPGSTHRRFLAAVHPEDRAAVEHAYGSALRDRVQYDITHRIVLPDATVRWVQERGETFYDADGRALRTVGVVQDVNDRVLAEKAIGDQARLLDLIFRHSLESIVVLDKDYNFVRVSETYAKAGRREVAEFIGRNHFELYPSDFQAEHEEYRRAKKIYRRSARPFVFPDHPEWGTTYWDIAIVPILDRDGEIELFLFTLKDVTEPVRADERIRAALAEKEVLLKEIYHRVKNNLQVVSSLLSMQGREAKDAATLGLFMESANRVKSMALVHEQLYRSKNLSRIALREYVPRLAEQLMQSHRPLSNTVPVKVVAEDIDLGVETAVPFGLLLNELIENAYKHAYAPGAHGSITVTLERVDGDQVRLAVTDDGRGLPADFDPRETNSLGMRLLLTLADQLEGELQIGRAPDSGARFDIAFRARPPESGARLTPLQPA